MTETYKLNVIEAFNTIEIDQRLAASMFAAALSDFVNRYDYVLHRISVDAAETLVIGNLPLILKERVVKELLKVWKRNKPANESAEKIIHDSYGYWTVFSFSSN